MRSGIRNQTTSPMVMISRAAGSYVKLQMCSATLYESLGFVQKQLQWLRLLWLKEWIQTGLYNEADGHGHLDTTKDWWPQAEAMVGYINAYQLSGKLHFLQAAKASWDFTTRYIRDEEYGRMALAGFA